MNRRLGWVVAVALAVPASVQAQGTDDFGIVTCNDVVPSLAAIAGPSLIATGIVGSQVLDFLPCLRQRGKVWTIEASFLTSLASGTINVTMNPDPFVNFSLATTSFVPGPTFFQFTFGAPIVPDFYTSAMSSLSGGVTAGETGTAGSVTNVGATPFLVGNGTVGGLPVPPSIPGNLGVDIGFGPCTTAVRPATPTSVNCPAVAAAGSNSFAPTFYNDLDVTVTYNQSGTLSQATFNGGVEVFAAVIPEPATVSLLATGVLALGLGGFVRRRRS